MIYIGNRFEVSGIKNNSFFQSKIIRILLACSYIFLMIPIFVCYINSNLDNSWIYFLNRVPYSGLKFGRDIFFSYGPLGFLANAQNIGYNLVMAAVFWILAVSLGGYILFRILFFDKSIKISNGQLFISMLLYLFSLDLGSVFRVDYYLLGLILLALSAAWFSDKKYIYFTVAVFLSSFTIFIKFSDALFALSALAVFIALSIFKDKRIGMRFLSAAAFIPISFVAGYLIYNPSVSDMISYIRVFFEISSGYSTGMSRKSDMGVIVLAVITILILVVEIILYRNRDKNYFLYSLIFTGPLFLICKHGFVRADEHVDIFFEAFLLILSIMILFVKFDDVPSKDKSAKFPAILLAVVLAAFPAVCYCTLIGAGSMADNVTLAVKEISFSVKNKIENSLVPAENLVLPDSLRAEIGESSVTVFPSEISVAAYNIINYVPMPLLQNYVANSPALDKLNSEFFLSTESPEYIIFSNQSIDNRCPLIETPLVWRAIYSNYHVADMWSDLILLKKNEKAIAVAYEFVSKQTYQTDDEIAIPDTGEITLFTADFELSAIGKIVNLLYKIPEVNIKVNYENGTSLIGRILPENFSNGVIINYVAYDNDTFLALMSKDSADLKVKSISFYGAGLAYYMDSIDSSFLVLK